MTALTEQDRIGRIADMLETHFAAWNHEREARGGQESSTEAAQDFLDSPIPAHSSAPALIGEVLSALGGDVLMAKVASAFEDRHGVIGASWLVESWIGA
ncbi:MAG: hypothetical protein LBV29_01180 [Azoarcus sp.]|jgi:hypothetical protein|nr:hypothetical protein [Azoarcus sp.]